MYQEWCKPLLISCEAAFGYEQVAKRIANIRLTKEYVAKEIFPREIGRKLGALRKVREKSDYDDFYIASREKAEEQFQTAELVIAAVREYLKKHE